MKIRIILFFILLAPMAYSSEFNEILHTYFQSLIDEGHENMNMLIEGNKAEPLSANVFNVSENLKKHGVNHTLLNISPIFEQYYNSINNITINYNNMIEHRNVKNPYDYIIFKTSLKNVRNNLIVLNNSLNNIDNIKLKNRNGNILKFDTSKVRSDINIMLKEAELYSNKINKIAPEGFVIYSDKSTVFIDSKITIYGYINNKRTINSITLYHNNDSYNITLKNNSFSKTFLINSLGNHIFYATTPSETSNTLKISCLKIPTHINVIYKNKEYIDNNVNLKIELYDYYGNELRDNVYIQYLNKHENIRAPLNLNIKSNMEKNISIYLEYKGNNIYSTSKKIITIRFIRIPTYITANYENNKIIGKLFDKNNNLLNNKNIYLKINNKTYTSKTKNGSFEFNINNTSDKCYIFFKGDSKYLPSSKKLIKDKNTILMSSIDNSNINNNKYMLCFIVLIVLLVLMTYKIQKHRNLENTVDEGDVGIIYKTVKTLNIKSIYLEFEKYISNKKYVEGIIKAYYLFISRLNIKKSLTPREICKIYGNIEGLKSITKIFEKVYYGNIKPENDDIKKYDKFFKRD